MELSLRVQSSLPRCLQNSGGGRGTAEAQGRGIGKGAIERIKRHIARQ